MKIKICAITTRGMTMKSFMVDTLNYFAENGFDVTIICEPSSIVSHTISSRVKYIPIEMKSGIERPSKMFAIIHQLIRLFRTEKYDIVQYASTNAGLYASLAAKRCHIPIRIFCQWGMMYVGSNGFRRFVFKNIERLICHCSTSVQSDSSSNLEFAIKEHIVSKKKAEIVWNGSSTGVDTILFSPDSRLKKEDENRRKFGIPTDAVVFGFVGRINKDKGIFELITSFREMKRNGIHDVYLLLVGPKENDEKINLLLDKALKETPELLYFGMSDSVIDFYSVMDFFVLPSYREGIATVLLEAASCGLPIISTNILGSVDVVYEGRNGFLCNPKDVGSLFGAMKKAFNLNHEEYLRYSLNSRDLAVQMFDHETLAVKLLEDRINKYEAVAIKKVKQ